MTGQNRTDSCLFIYHRWKKEKKKPLPKVQFYTGKDIFSNYVSATNRISFAVNVRGDLSVL